MRKLLKKITKVIGVFCLCLPFTVNVVLADPGDDASTPVAAVAKIGEISYETFSAAVEASKTMEGDVTIELLADCNSGLTSAWGIDKNVTITGNYTVTFDDYSFGITGYNTLTIDGSHIVINNAAHTAYSDNPANAAIMLDKNGLC